MSKSEQITRALNGRYHGCSREPGFEVDLRIDVDAPPPSPWISADVFDVTGDAKAHLGSLVLVEPESVVDEDGGVTLSGRATFTTSTATPWIEVRIPQVGPKETQRATLARFDSRGGNPGPVYDCDFVSRHFRCVELVEAYEKAVHPVDLDDTAVIKSEKTGRQITIVSAFDEAGIELQTRKPTLVDPGAAGEDGCWSDAELHAAMAEHLDSTTASEWAVWLLHAWMHERDRPYDGSKKTYGILFDRQPKRHGCAVFYGWLQEGSDLEKRRSQVYACVHEIGHSFNLKHCWSESILGPGRPEALSWLNYPHAYPGGEKKFWDEFRFSFDAPECTHLRHAYYNDIIMAGGRVPEPPDARDTGVRLQVFAPRELQYGVPVAVGLKLTTAGRMPSPPVIGPRAGNVDIIIRRPDRTEFVFEPLLHHCRTDAPTAAREIRDYAFVHYGKGGFAFDEPGMYVLHARYLAPDGSIVMSEPEWTEVRPPLSRADRDAQKLLSEDEHGHVGALMSLVGSRPETPSEGAQKLQEFIDRHPNHPVAAVARLALGTNAARAFKTIKSDGTASVSRRDETTAKEFLGKVLDIDHLRRVTDALDKTKTAAALAPTLTDELVRIGTKRDVPAGVDLFIRSRRHEIAAAIARLS
jgi:hypothetical protein